MEVPRLYTPTQGLTSKSAETSYHTGGAVLVSELKCHGTAKTAVSHGMLSRCFRQQFEAIEKSWFDTSCQGEYRGLVLEFTGFTRWNVSYLTDDKHLGLEPSVLGEGVVILSGEVADVPGAKFREG